MAYGTEQGVHDAGEEPRRITEDEREEMDRLRRLHRHGVVGQPEYGNTIRRLFELETIEREELNQ